MRSFSSKNIRGFTCIRPGYIDLSKRRVSPEDITKCEERYMKSKTVASIMRHVASKLPSIQAAEDAPSTASHETLRKQTKSKPGEDEGDTTATEVNEEGRLEHLYDQIAWPLGKKYGHPYDAFKLALTCALFSIYLYTNDYRTSSQRTRHCICLSPSATLPRNYTIPDRHHCPSPHAATDQVTGGY